MDATFCRLTLLHRCLSWVIKAIAAVRGQCRTQDVSIALMASKPVARVQTLLFVIAHSAPLIADACFKGLLRNGLSRPGLRKQIVECTDAPLRRVLDAIKRALS